MGWALQFLRHLDKWGRISGTSTVTILGSLPYTIQVANAIENTPQSLPFPCFLTGTMFIPVKLFPMRSFSCSSTSLATMSWNKLSYKFTIPGKQQTELAQTQCWLPVCRICTKSLVTTPKFLTGPSVVLWNPLIRGFTCFSKMWASCMTLQSNHPVGDSMISYSARVKFPREAVLSMFPWLTLVICISSSLSHWSTERSSYYQYHHKDLVELKRYKW